MGIIPRFNVSKNVHIITSLDKVILMRSRYLFLSVALVIIGGLVFYTNYERETVNVHPDLDERVLLDYHAPEIDPFPHHIVIDVDTDLVVEISETLDGETNIIFTDDGSGRFTVESGQTILVLLRNPNGASGTVKTTFYCDSWNYAAYTLVAIGSILFVIGLRGPEEPEEEL